MKKSLLCKAGLLSLALILSGCGEMSILDEIPKNFVITGQSFDSEESGETSEVSEMAFPEEESFAENAEESGDDVRETVSFLLDDACEYSRGFLNETEWLWYCDMKQSLGSFGAGTKLNPEGLEAGYDEEDIDRIFQCVLNDHPELFYVEGYSYTKYTRGDRTTSIEFSGTYSLDRETAEGRRSEIEAAAAEILAGIDAGADQYTKVKYVYDTIIRETDYDRNAADNQNIYSTFVNHLSVCQGYAKATQYLLNRLGVECTLVQGQVGTGEGHAWNLVKVDGNYYYVDTTWGDTSYKMEDGGAESQVTMPEINYDYLNVTTAELLRTHRLSENVPMPECTATEANYYLREGALFPSYDREQLQTLFARAREQERADVTIKCADEDCYNQMFDALVGGQEIFHYLDGMNGTVAYAKNENQLSLTFWVTNE